MKTFTLGLLLLCGFGCTSIQPIGPFAGSNALPPGADPDLPAPPTATVRKPVLPAMLIVPGDVNAENATEAAQKLANEFEYDWKSLPPPSKTAEVSRYKNGVKVR